MAYETGSAASPEQFISNLASFCQAQGWTIALLSTSRLYLEKGICHLALEVVPGYGLAGGLCTSFNTGLSPLFQPGFPSDSSPAWSDNNHMAMDVVGKYPILSYHFFAEADYVHVVAEVSAGSTFSGIYCHMGFGLVDKGALSHGGVAFAGGSKQSYTKNNAYPLNDSRQTFNNTENFSWAGLGAHRAWSDNAVPSHFPRSPGGIFPANGYGYSTLRNYRYPWSAPNTNSNAMGRINQALVRGSAPSYSGRAPLFGTPCIISNGGQICYVGDFPGIRFLMMDGMVPGEEIDMAGEIWKVFPPRRQTPWDQVLNNNFDAPSSGQYGIAYKKVT